MYTTSFALFTLSSKLLYKPLEQGRVELAKDVGTLACCLVHPEAECSPEFTPKHGYVILTTCSQVLEMLLEGPSGKEVTPTVHQVVMENLRQCLKHHQSGLSASALSTSHSICAKGLVDGRRHIRLAAGYVSDVTTAKRSFTSFFQSRRYRAYQVVSNQRERQGFGVDGFGPERTQATGHTQGDNSLSPRTYCEVRQKTHSTLNGCLPGKGLLWAVF